MKFTGFNWLLYSKEGIEEMAVIRKIDKIDEAHPYYLRSLFAVNTGLYTQAAFDAVTYLIDTFGVEFHETFINSIHGCGYMKVYREFDGEVCFDVRGTTAESFIGEWKRVMGGRSAHLHP